MRKKLFIISAIITLVAVLGFVFFSDYFLKDKSQIVGEDKNPVVAEVGREKIYLTEYKERLFTITGSGTSLAPLGQNELNKNTTLKSLIDGVIIRNEAKRRNISASQDFIDKYLVDNFPTYKSRSLDSDKVAYQKLAEEMVLHAIMKEDNQNWREGYFLLCRYDRYLQDDFRGKDTEAQKLRNVQKVYAKNYCEQLKSRLESGETSYDIEKEKLEKDPVIGTLSWEPFTMTLGGDFNNVKYYKGMFALGTDLFAKIDKLEIATGYSLLEVNTYRNPETSGDPVDGISALVFLSGKGKKTSIGDYEEWWNSVTQEYKVTYHKENLNK